MNSLFARHTHTNHVHVTTGQPCWSWYVKIGVPSYNFATIVQTHYCLCLSQCIFFLLQQQELFLLKCLIKVNISRQTEHCTNKYWKVECICKFYLLLNTEVPAGCVCVHMHYYKTNLSFDIISHGLDSFCHIDVGIFSHCY